MDIYGVLSSALPVRAIIAFKDESTNVGCVDKVIHAQFSAKAGKVFPLFVDNKLRYIVLSAGYRNKFDDNVLDKVVHSLCNQLNVMDVSEISIDISSFSDSNIRFCIEKLFELTYIFKISNKDDDSYRLKLVELKSNRAENIKSLINLSVSVAVSKNYVRDLINLPTNICTTEYLLNETKKLSDVNKSLKFSYLNKKEMVDLGMGCITSVAQGSSMPPYISCLEYKAGKANQKPIVLVGKGLVYDTGGLCLKPSRAMRTMKIDMGGAAAVLGTMKAIAMLGLHINVVGVNAVLENSISSNAYRPGDVLTRMQGTTVEVVDTDAEGRLALCDTLTYVQRKYDPLAVIDIATLTGAISVAVGNDLNGLFSNDDSMISDLYLAGKNANDMVCALPLHDKYKDLLKSKIADISNLGNSNEASSITAALFLSNFVKCNWAHLDIAGTVTKSDIATGRPVALLTQYLLNQSKKFS